MSSAAEMPFLRRRMTAPSPFKSPDEKAEALLWSKLTPAQRSTCRDAGYFDVVGSSGGRYRIRMTSTVQNIVQGDVEFCAGPCRSMSRYDFWLCQKLLIESDEELFLRVACRTYQVTEEILELMRSDGFHVHYDGW